jgi:hypothetical protein
MVDVAPVKSARKAGMSEAAIARVLRAAIKAGMDVGEVVATKDTIRIRVGQGAAARTGNTWDEIFEDE